MGGRSVGVARDSYQPGSVVFHRAHELLFLGIPPLVGHDAVVTGVGAGQQAGVAGPSDRVGVIVIAIGKVGAVVEEEFEPAFAKLITITLQVVAAELVDDDDDDELGTSIVSGSKTEGGQEQKQQQAQNGAGTGKYHRGLVYRVGRGIGYSSHQPNLRRAGGGMLFFRLWK